MSVYSQTKSVKSVPWAIKSNISSNGRTSFDSLFGPTSEDLVTVNKDLLAISCHLWTNFKNDLEKRYMDFSLAVKTITLTEDDYFKAEKIVDYFSKRILIRQLKGELSSFQQAVVKFITSDRMTYNRSNPGLIYRLPEYYDRDQEIIKMIHDHFNNHEYVTINNSIMIEERQMKPIISINRDTKDSKINQYWFKDTLTDNPLMIELDSKNEIGYIWDHMFTTSELIKISGKWFNQSHSLNFNYVYGDKWKVVFD